MAALKAWREVAVPHVDIRQGKFDASVFAADLGEVLAGRGAVDYRDATTFFSKTYLTGGLSELLIDVMHRLSGKRKGEPVIQLQTPFGGGKTHTLLTLYHLLKSPRESGRLSQIQGLLSVPMMTRKNGAAVRPSSRANDGSTKCVSPSGGFRGRTGTTFTTRSSSRSPMKEPRFTVRSSSSPRAMQPSERTRSNSASRSH